MTLGCHRRSMRLEGYDYSLPGAYFVTIVAYRRESIFGEIVQDEMRLNNLGQIVAQSWEWLPKQYHYVELDKYIIMPNHFHGIILIHDTNPGSRGGSRPAPTIKIKPLGQIIGAFKTISAKQINHIRSSPGIHVWQRNYYDHIIRDEAELRRIWDYIDTNPQSWADDHLHPL